MQLLTGWGGAPPLCSKVKAAWNPNGLFVPSCWSLSLPCPIKRGSNRNVGFLHWSTASWCVQLSPSSSQCPQRMPREQRTHAPADSPPCPSQPMLRDTVHVHPKPFVCPVSELIAVLGWIVTSKYRVCRSPNSLVPQKVTLLRYRAISDVIS